MHKYLWILLFCGTAVPAAAQQPDDFPLAIANHGGAAVLAVRTLILEGDVRSVEGSIEPVKITATVDGRLRIDYGLPVHRSVIASPQTRFEILNQQYRPKPAHVGAFGQLDVLSVVGIRHFLEPGAQRTPLGPGSVAGRATRRHRATTQRQLRQYGRTISDEVEIQFDTETGLVAAISRTLFSTESLNLSYTGGYTFSEHAVSGGVALPRRIEHFINGRVRETFLVNTVQINPSLADDLFVR